MNYTVNGRAYTANDGFVFCNVKTGGTFKKMRLRNPEEFAKYEVVPESEIEPAVSESNDYEVVPNEQALTEIMEVINNV